MCGGIRDFSTPLRHPVFLRTPPHVLCEICIFIKTSPAPNVLQYAMQCVPLVFQMRVTAEHDCPLSREKRPRVTDRVTSAVAVCGEV